MTPALAVSPVPPAGSAGVSRPPRRASAAALPTLRLHAAGIDVGATELYVAVPADRDAQPVRCFATFTEDLHALADWLTACGIETVAMESTGVYWIPLFQILEARGFQVCLVNARHLHSVPGRPKTDVHDCQWLQYLHTVGLLHGSFRPPDAVCAVRAILRHRDMLVNYAAAHVQHMHKALTQMNVQVHHVLADLTGKSGLAILQAILAGERDPHQLAQLRDGRVRASEATLAKSLVGDWRAEHLFTLRQALAAYQHYQTLMHDCDREIERLLSHFDAGVGGSDQPLPPARTKQRTPQKNAIHLPGLDLRLELYRILGVDLTQVPGLQATNVHALFSELGAHLNAFPTSKHFCSWLGLCPDNRISGGRILSVKTRHVKSRVAKILRVAAMTLYRSETHLGAYYRRMRAKLGAPKAITATAHKLARILYQLLTTRQPYDATLHARHEERYRRQRLQRLRREAAALGFNLEPTPVVS